MSGLVGDRSQLTGYCKLVLGGAPVALEKCFNVDEVAILSDLGPKGMTGPHLDLRAHLGDRRSISAQMQCSVCVRSEEITGILALSWCPGPVGCLL